MHHCCTIEYQIGIRHILHQRVDYLCGKIPNAVPLFDQSLQTTNKAGADDFHFEALPRVTFHSQVSLQVADHLKKSFCTDSDTKTRASLSFMVKERMLS